MHDHIAVFSINHYGPIAITAFWIILDNLLGSTFIIELWTIAPKKQIIIGFWQCYCSFAILEDDIQAIESYGDKVGQYNIQNKILATLTNAENINITKMTIIYKYQSLINKVIQKKLWHRLVYNPNAIPLLEQNIDKINWHNLCQIILLK